MKLLETIEKRKDRLSLLNSKRDELNKEIKAGRITDTSERDQLTKDIKTAKGTVINNVIDEATSTASNVIDNETTNNTNTDTNESSVLDNSSVNNEGDNDVK